MPSLTEKQNRDLLMLNATPKGEGFEISANQTGFYTLDGTVDYNDQGKVNYCFDSMQDFIDFFIYGKDVERTESYYVGDRDDNGQITWWGESYSLESLDPSENGSCVYLKPVFVSGYMPTESIRSIDVTLSLKDGEQEIFIHKGNRSFELRLFAKGGCLLQIFNGDRLTGENVLVNRLLKNEQEALEVLKGTLGLEFKLLRQSVS